MDRLQQLITLAGGKRRLAQLLGVESHVPFGWVRLGHISPTGAVLVSTVDELNDIFSPRMLRPDLTPEKIERVKSTEAFEIALSKQKLNRTNPIESPIMVMEALRNETD